MASLFATGIVSLCAGLASNGQYSNACNKALDAGSRQVGLRQNIDRAEDKTVQIVNSKLERYAPAPLADAVGAAGFVYKTAHDKRLEFSLPNLGVCDRLSNVIAPDSYALTAKWNLP